MWALASSSRLSEVLLEICRCLPSAFGIFDIRVYVAPKLRVTKIVGVDAGREAHEKDLKQSIEWAAILEHVDCDKNGILARRGCATAAESCVFFDPSLRTI
jgi:hypothetical protein